MIKLTERQAESKKQVFRRLKEQRKIMINMMKDILQYLPYALLFGAVLLLLGLMVAVTLNHFRKAAGRKGNVPISKG